MIHESRLLKTLTGSYEGRTTVKAHFSFDAYPQTPTSLVAVSCLDGLMVCRYRKVLFDNAYGIGYHKIRYLCDAITHHHSVDLHRQISWIKP